MPAGGGADTATWKNCHRQANIVIYIIIISKYPAVHRMSDSTLNNFTTLVAICQYTCSTHAACGADHGSSCTHP